MTIKQNGGIFGRNPTFNDVEADGTLTVTGQSTFNSDITVQNDVAPKISILDSNGGFAAATFTSENGGRDLAIFAPQDIIIDANAGETARFFNTGNFSIGSASSSARLTVQAGSSDEAGYFRPNVIDSGSGSEPVTVKAVSQKNPCLDLNRYYSFGTIVQFRQNNDAVGSISVTSTTTTYNTSSDYRLKENVTDLTGAITRLQQLNPKRFNFIADPNTTVDGFLAHEAATAVPEAVTGTKDATQAIGDITDADGNVVKTGVPQVNVPEGHTWTATGTEPVYQGIDQSKLVPLLVAALQEAVARIEALENA